MSTASEQELTQALAIVYRLADHDQIRRVNDALRSRQDILVRQATNTFRVGQRVTWNGKRGHQAGTIVRIKQKYIEVRADSPSVTWNVPGTMLKAEPPKAVSPSLVKP